MDLLQECAASFKRLLPYQYHFTIGRKGKMLAFTLDFDEADFHHLAGLHKLRDNVHFLTGKRADSCRKTYLCSGGTERIFSRNGFPACSIG